MKNAILLVSLMCIFTNAVLGQESEKDWENFPQTLSFVFHDDVGGKNDLAVAILSFVPLKVKSANVTVALARKNDENYEGLMLAENATETYTGKKPFYIFNNATQCFEYGYIVTVNGQSYWTAGTASEQIAHNICAPKGEMYCRKKV
jgi:hypothetical protein